MSVSLSISTKDAASLYFHMITRETIKKIAKVFGVPVKKYEEASGATYDHCTIIVGKIDVTFFSDTKYPREQQQPAKGDTNE